MVQIHPEFLEKDGKKEFVVLPYEEFCSLEEELEELEDLRVLRQAKEEEGSTAGSSLEAVKKMLEKGMEK